MSLQTAPSLNVEVKWTDELRIYGEGFVGRKEELAALDQAWAEGVRIFALHAGGGAGKTRVVVEWLRRMRDDGWRGARRVFVHSFYSQGSDEQRKASSELFFEQALAFFGYLGEPITQGDEQGCRLARLLVEQHGLLILDGLEPLQHPTQHAERGRLKDPGVVRLLLSLANIPLAEARTLCLITSRQPVIELQAREGATVIQQSLDHLRRDDGAELLRGFEVIGPEEELRKASEEFQGHAYSLMLLGSFLRNATEHRDIRRRSEAILLEEDAETKHPGHAARMFSAYARHLGEDSPAVAVLRLLGFFDRAAERQLLDVLRAREGVSYDWTQEAIGGGERPQERRVEDSLAEITAPLLDLPRTKWNRVLNRLRDLQLIDFTGPGTSLAVNSHPLLRECFAEQVRTHFSSAWQAGHQRLFEYLSGTAPYWPEGIEGLQPLYRAVTHGCLAGLHEQACEEVYNNRILRGTGNEGFYSSKRLGAISANLGAIAQFFTTPWSILAANLPTSTQAWLLSEASYYLRILNRLNEAVEPMRITLQRYVDAEDWDAATVIARNESALEISRGEVALAVRAGEEAVIYADRSWDFDSQNYVAARARLADALHQAGRLDESRTRFNEMVSRAPSHLHSLQGFQYCDLLLSDAERTAWRRYLFPQPLVRVARAPLPDRELGDSERPSATDASCDTVGKLATKMLEDDMRYGAAILDIALNHLTLARAILYKGHSNFPVVGFALDHIVSAVTGLRASGMKDQIPLGLLTHAWLQHLSGDEPGARAGLDEAWEIAEQGPMPLFQADIQLYRARLFRDRAALADARRLIEKHGYHRRDGELADALAAAEKW